ncbi:MAG: type II secretion system F family protein [Planctomycetota bacterium]
MTLPDRLLIALILIAASGSVFLLVWSLYRIKTEISEATRLDEERREKITSPFVRVLVAASRPLGVFLRYFTLRAEVRYEQTGHRPHLLALRGRAERSLIAAGSPHGITPDEYLGMVLLCALFGLGLGALATASTGWTVLLAAGLLCGGLWPVVWLRAQVRRRKTQIFRSLPFALDLLTLAVEAGLDFTSALGRIVTKIKGTPLGQEFAEVLRQIQMGQPRADALRALARRVDLEEMSNFTGSMVQADELGASIGPVLRIQAQEMRTRREQLAEKKAMEAPVKILLPLILFIFPTVFLTILGPVILDALIQRGVLK